nr:MAG TPA: hypothetical protein [Caudoviricetes sp.]
MLFLYIYKTGGPPKRAYMYYIYIKSVVFVVYIYKP